MYLGHVRKPIWPNPTFFFLLTSFLVWPWQKLSRKLPSPDSRATLPSRASHHPYKNAPPLLVPFSPSPRLLPARSHGATILIFLSRTEYSRSRGASPSPLPSLSSAPPHVVLLLPRFPTPPATSPPRRSSHLAGVLPLCQPR